VAESVRELTVSLSLTDNISANLKGIAGQIKQTESEFRAAGSSTDTFGNKQKTAQAKVAMLQQKLQLQKTAVQQNEKAVEQAKARYDQAAQSQEKIRKQLEEAKTQYGENSAEVKKLESQLTSADKAVQRAAQQVTNATTNLNNARAAVNNTERELEQANRELQVASSRWTAFSDTMAAISTKLKAVGQSVTNIGNKLTKGITAPVVALGTAAVKTFTSYDDSLKQVQATMGLVAGSSSEADAAIALLDKTAQQMGISTRYSASEAASALNYLALAGYDAEKACEALPLVLQLAQAGGMDLASASDMATDAMAALGLETSELGTFIDQMAVTAQKSNTSVSQLGEAILTVGGTANVLSGGTTELNTALGILANRGIKSAEGGTHLRNIILSLTAGTDKAKKAIKELGIDVLDASGNMRPLDDIMADFNAKLDGLTEAQKEDVLNKIFNKTDLAAVQGLLAGVGDEWDELMNNISNSDGSAAQMASTMESGIGGAFRSLKSAVEGLAIAFGQELAPFIQQAAQYITELTQKFASLDSGTKQIIVRVAAVAAAVGPVLSIGGKVITMFGNIAGAISKVSASIAAGGKIATLLGKLKSVASVITQPYIAIPAAIAAAAVVGINALNAWATKADEGAEKLKNLKISVSDNAANGVTKTISKAVSSATTDVNLKLSEGKKQELKSAVEKSINGSSGTPSVKVSQEAVHAEVKKASDGSTVKITRAELATEAKKTINTEAQDAVKDPVQVKVTVDKDGSASGSDVDEQLAIGDPRRIKIIGVYGKDGKELSALKTDIEGNIPDEAAVNVSMGEGSTLESDINAVTTETIYTVFPKIDSSEVKSGIEEGISLANKTVEIRADTSKLWEDLNSTWGSAKSDGKLSKEEHQTITKWVEENVKPDADAAKAAAEGYWKTVYDAARGAGMAEGEASDAATAAAENYPLKKTAEELANLQSDLNTLLSTVYKEGNSATAEELAQVEVLMGKIQELQKELGVLKSDAGQYAQNAVVAVKAGYGTNKQFGIATAYIESYYEQQKAATVEAIDKAEQDYAATIANYKSMVDSGSMTQERFNEASSSALEKHKEKLAALNAEIEGFDTAKAKEIDELLIGMGMQTTENGQKLSNDAVKENLKTLESYVKLAEAFGQYDSSNFEQLMLGDVDVSGAESLGTAVDAIVNNLELIQQVIPEANSLWEELGNSLTGETYSYDDLIKFKEDPNFDWSTVFDAHSVSNIVSQLQSTISGQIADTVSETSVNPMAQAYQAMIDGVDFSSLNLDSAGESLSTVAKAMLLGEKGLGGVSSDEYKSIGEKVGQGVVDGYSGALKDGQDQIYGDGFNTGQSGTDGTADGAQTNSPSKATYETGKNVVQGLVNGINDTADEAASAGKALGQNAAKSVESGVKSISTGTVRGLGTNLMQGLANGIRSSQYLATAAAAAAAAAVVETIKKKLHIHSPSKVFEEMGEYTMMGFSEGIHERTQQTVKAMQNAARYLTTGFAGATYNNQKTTTNYDNSNNLTVQSMVMSNSVDAEALMQQMIRRSRRTQKGYGAA